MIKSAKHTLHRCVFTNGKEKDFDFVELAKRTETLTFDERYLERGFVPEYHQTPFFEIKQVPGEEKVPEDMFEPMPVTKLSLGDFGAKLAGEVVNYFKKTWHPSEKHLILHSAGYDSRIVSLALMTIREQGFDLGELHFRCHQPECENFVQIMKAQGWRPDQYSCYPGKKEDYYDIGRKDVPIFGFFSYVYQMNFWSDIIDNEKEWVLVTGMGETMYKDLGKEQWKSGYFPAETMNDIMRKEFVRRATKKWRGEWDALYLRRFKDMLVPFFGFDFLRVYLTANLRDCHWHKRDQADSIRDSMIKSFGVDLPVAWVDHDYSWLMSEGRKNQMMDDWYQSRFYRDYGHKVGEIDPFIPKPDGSSKFWDACIWGFMTAYDMIFAE